MWQGGPYGVYDIVANTACVSVGIDNDTAQFSVNSIRCWLDVISRERYPAMSHLMITADGGGSNGSRVRLFKVELQKLADETSLAISVCHYPPGTSKWNKIEHKLFCHITQTWRGKPLICCQTDIGKQLRIWSGIHTLQAGYAKLEFEGPDQLRSYLRC